MKSIIYLIHIIVGLILFNSVNALIRCYECLGENNNPCSKNPPDLPKVDFNQCKFDDISCVNAVIVLTGDFVEPAPAERQAQSMKSVTLRTCGTPQFCKEPSRFMLEHLKRGYPGVRADKMSVKKCLTCTIDLCNRSSAAKIPFIFYFIFSCIINLL